MTLFGDLIMFLKRTRRRSPQVQILLDLHRLKARYGGDSLVFTCKRNKGDLKIKSSHLSSVTSYHTPSYTHLSIRIQDLHD
uniref:Uncharacterized protein n=2 Tax=Aegilops tauschii subsp. strangulata TaxID=200361 RepID=A0A453QG36_AEGTS